ncbi:MAG: response regulator [Candidatus Omnitrophica bacterium]|nr:response regulator [Candidatus Omnitrophota bacterium]
MEENLLVGKRILVVEDSEECRLLHETILEGMGCRVEVAINGQEAIDKARQGTFDAVLMDVLMPVMKGYEAIVEIRRMFSDLPIIVVTAYRIDLVEEKCYACGANDYITKPFHAQQLAEKLVKWIAKGKSSKTSS